MSIINHVTLQKIVAHAFQYVPRNSGLLKKLSIHSVCPRPNKGYKSSSTKAAVMGESGVIRLDCRTLICLYIQENTTNILLLIRTVRKFLFRTLKPLVVGTAVLTDAPSRVSSFHQWQSFGLVGKEFETLCSNDISQDKF